MNSQLSRNVGGGTIEEVSANSAMMQMPTIAGKPAQ
jgi:hypothetical protein